MGEAERIDRAAKLGGFAYLVELQMRLYAHRTEGLEKFTHSPSSELEAAFIAHFGSSIGEEQKGQITGGRDFRSKLLHTRWAFECSDTEYGQAFERTKALVSLTRKLTGLSEMKMLDEDQQEIDWNSLDFMERFVFNAYRDIAVAATAYEIIVRKTAYEIPDLKDAAFNEAKELEAVQNELATFLKFTPPTVSLLDNCRKLRNKILHCDFYAAKKVAAELAPGGVKESGKVMLLKGERNWEAAFVSESSRKGAGALGWALEGMSSGAATVAFDVLSKVSRLLFLKIFTPVDSQPK